MKKSFIIRITNSILLLTIATIFLVSCSTDEKDPDVVFTSLKANKTEVYTEETITLNIVGTGYTDINLVSSNTTIKITKVASSIYEISSTKATSAKIFVELKNKSNNQVQTVTLNFYEHGVKDFNTAEGIKVNVDSSTKLLSLLGTPESKLDTSTGTSEYWVYNTKGLVFTIIKGSSIVDQIELFSTYPYEIGNNWKINSATTMDMVVTLLGLPSAKSSSTTSLTNRSYQYTTQRIVFFFQSDSEDNYNSKKITYFILY